MAPQDDDRRDARIDELLAFWFGHDPNPGAPEIRRWFTHDEAFDAELRARFGALHAEAELGGLAGWSATTRGALALIVLLDQVSRNLYRGDRRAYAGDARALGLARALLDDGRARALPPHQRLFVVLPFQHAEDVLAQRRAVAELEALTVEARGNPLIASGLDYARRHAAIIERFGRFPHRNAILGRDSTPEELAFLNQPGSRF